MADKGRQMKKIVAFALVGAGLLAGCGDEVDREGTRDLMVEQLEEAGLEVDGGCIDDVFDQYSDDELTEMDDAASESEMSAEMTAKMTELQTKVQECVTLPTLGS